MKPTRGYWRRFDRFVRLILPVACLVAVLGCCASASAADVLGGGPAVPGLHFEGRRGIGGFETFGQPVRDPKSPTGYASDPYQPHWAEGTPDARLKEIKQAGFDFIRLNINPSPMLAADRAQMDMLINQVREAVAATLRADLDVVMDIHVEESNPQWSSDQVTADVRGEAFQRYLMVVTELGRLAATFDSRRVALEVFNEPPPPCVWTDRPAWPAQLRVIYSQARWAAPDTTLLLSGACWAAIDGLNGLNASGFDANTMFVFHFYEPYVFTHQGYWASAPILKYLPRLPYPAEPKQRPEELRRVQEAIGADRELGVIDSIELRLIAQKTLAEYFSVPRNRAWIRDQFARVVDWTRKQGVAPGRIILGEFGAMKDIYGKRGAAPRDRRQWISDVRQTAEQDGFAWSVWALSHTMGITTGDTSGPMDAGVLKALGLQPPGDGQ